MQLTALIYSLTEEGITFVMPYSEAEDSSWELGLGNLLSPKDALIKAMSDKVPLIPLGLLLEEQWKKN